VKNPSQKTILRVFTSFPVGQLFQDSVTAGFRLANSDTELIFNKSGPCNLAVVINFSRSFGFVWGKNHKIIKWLMEPTVHDRLNWRYTHSHSHIYAKTYTHSPLQESKRQSTSPPLVPSHVDALEPNTLIESKTKLISAIGSVQEALPFHAVRKQLLDAIEKSPENQIEVFGKGRRFIENKLDGLKNYRYSIAIENSLTPNYWTEKLTDCFLSMTVPIYLGAPNVTAFFPSQSMIIVSQDDLSTGLKKLVSRLSVEDYNSRIPSLLESRRLVLERYNFGIEIAKIATQMIEETRTRNRGFSRVWTSSTLIFIGYEVAASLKRVLNSLRSFGLGKKSPR
jgi:hypothetical protein